MLLLLSLLVTPTRLRPPCLGRMLVPLVRPSMLW